MRGVWRAVSLCLGCVLCVAAVAQERPDAARVRAFRDALMALDSTLTERLEQEGRDPVLRDYARLLDEYGDLPESAEALRQIATVHATPVGPDDRPDYDAAVREYLRMLEAYPETSPAVRQQQTSVLVHLQGIQQRSGRNYDWAVQQAADYLIATYPDDLATQAVSAWHLGKSAETNGDWDRAEFWYAEERRVALAAVGTESEHLLVHAEAALFWMAVQRAGDDPAAQLAAVEAMAARYPGFLESMGDQAPPIQRLNEIRAQVARLSRETHPASAATAHGGSDAGQQPDASPRTTAVGAGQADHTDPGRAAGEPEPEPLHAPVLPRTSLEGRDVIPASGMPEPGRGAPLLVFATLGLGLVLLAAGALLRGR